MKVAFAADLHVREDRAALHEKLLTRLAWDIVEVRPDLVLVGGDLTGRTVPHCATPKERNLLIMFLASFDCSVVVIRGNHDEPGDWDFLNKFPNVTYVERPCVLSMKGGFDVICRPWSETPEMPPGGDGAPAFLLGHAQLRGGLVRVGQPDVQVKGPVLNPEALMEATKADFGFFGHYHDPQEVIPNCWYGGATFINEYGESSKRGWLFWEDGDVEHRQLRQPLRHCVVWGWPAKEVVDVRPGPWRGDSLTLADLLPVLVSPAKLVCQVDAEDLPEAKAWVESLPEVDGVQVKATFTVRSQERIREGAEAVVAASSYEDKLRAWAASVQPPPEEETLVKAVKLLPEMEARTRDL